MTEGIVIRSTGSWYEVLDNTGQVLACRARGKLRLEGIKETNPIAVGDHVLIDTTDNTITSILPRTNHILRQSVKKTGQAHVLAANVDQVLLVVTLSYPRTSLGFIDRFLIAAESFRIPQIILFNKRDLLTEEEIHGINELMLMYQRVGVSCLFHSITQDSIADVEERIKGKITLVAGHSGVGKSTLLNRLSPDIHQKTGEISDFSEKGIHTTTFAEMFRINSDTFIIDTPGIKEWGLIDMTPEEISDYFPEMRERRLECKFGSRCIHLQEPKCAVIEAVRAGEIALSRYESYLSMILGEDNRK